MADRDRSTDVDDQRANRKRRKRRIRRLALGLMILAVAGVAVAAIVDQVRLRLALAACRDRNPTVRAQTLNRLAKEREHRAADVIAERLDNEQDRLCVEKAAYAALRIGETRLIDDIRRRADEGPDDPTRARLFIYTAMLGHGDTSLAPWLVAGTKADQEPWRQMGCAAALIELGDPQGEPPLVAIARKPDHPAAGEAYNQLQWLIRPMTEAVGWPIDWPPVGEPPDDAFWSNLDRFWSQHGHARLLDDVFTRLHTHDPRVAELRRLIHAREKVARWFE